MKFGECISKIWIYGACDSWTNKIAGILLGIDRNGDELDAW